MRERWYPTIFDRDNHSGWLARGGKTLPERAAEQVSRLLESHRPQPLDEAAARAVADVIGRAATRPASAPAGGGAHA